MKTYSKITRDTNYSFLKETTKVTGEKLFSKIEKGTPEYSNACSLFHQNNIDILQGNFFDEKFDVFFDDNDNSNNKGFELSFEDCKSYIDSNNGSTESYFKDYKGGTVSVVNIKTGERIFETEII